MHLSEHSARCHCIKCCQRSTNGVPVTLRLVRRSRLLRWRRDCVFASCDASIPSNCLAHLLELTLKFGAFLSLSAQERFRDSFSLESFFSPEEARDEACSFRSNREAWGRGKGRLNQRALIEQSTSECRWSGSGGGGEKANEKQEETLLTSCHTPWLHWNNLSTNTCKYADWNYSQPVFEPISTSGSMKSQDKLTCDSFFLFKRTFVYKHAIIKAL